MTQFAHNIKNGYTIIAGITYSLIIILAMIPTAILDIGSLLKEANAIENFVAQEGVFRFAIFIEFLMFILVMVLSWVLYIILKPVNKNLAQFGLIFRFGEALLGCVVIMFYLAIIMFLSGAEYLQVFEPEQQQALARFFLKLSGIGYYVLLVIMGIGAGVYCYLFYISNYIPKALSIWGMVSYTTMIIYGLINIALQDAPRELAYAMAPGALFELIMGLWLVFKGIKLNQHQTSFTQ